MPARTEPADPARLGRLLTQIENDHAARARALAELPALSEPVQRIGITGSPGVGKSTLLARLVPLLADADAQPAVLAVDPSSALSGGAVLGDRFRWAELARGGVFIRSLASRGSRGGLSGAVGASARILEAAGYSPLVIETVGAGQTGFEVLGLADTVVVLLSPESGDALQLLKAGLLEVGDIFAVNKSDRPGADALLAEVRAALEGNGADWQPPALALTAETGQGVTELAEAIQRHWQWLSGLPADHPRRLRRLRAELEYEVRALADAQVEAALATDGARLLAAVRAGELTLAEAAAELLRREAESS